MYFVGYRTAFALVLGLVSFAFLVALNPNLSVQPVENQGDRQLSAPASIELVDVSHSIGINHAHSQLSEGVADIRDALGPGVCAADFDNDNWIDLAFPSGQGATRHYGRRTFWKVTDSVQIYRNAGGFFVNVSADIKISLNAPTIGCAAADFDADGLTDLLLTTTETDRLYRNLGNFEFAEVESFADTTPSRWSTHAAVADINADGLPDIYLSGYLDYRKGQRSFERDTGFSEQHQAGLKPELFDGLPNQLLLNEGNMEFSDITESAMLSRHDERTISARLIDLTDDGRLDLLVFNDRGTPSRLFIRDPDMRFAEQSEQYFPIRIDGARFGDFSQSSTSGASLLISRGAGKGALALGRDPTGEKLHDRSWEIGINTNDRAFLDRWGLALTDLNNDGNVDLIQSNGMARPDAYAPMQSQGQPNMCVLGDVGGRFYRDNFCANLYPASSRGVVAIDIDNDGRRDIVFSNNNDFPQVLLNRTVNAGNWIGLTLPMTGEFAGGHVIISTDDARYSAQLNDGGGMFGSAEPRLHFGLDDATEVATTIVTANGRKIGPVSLSAGRYYALIADEWQPSATPAPEAPLSWRAVIEGTDSPDTLVRLLGTTEILYPHIEALLLSLEYYDETKREELAAALTEQPHDRLLPAYIALATSNSGSVGAAAIGAQRVLEREESIAPLLTLLDPNNETFCGAAETFRLWFREEEAVVQRKDLAVPRLIRALSADDNQAVQCAAAALAEAEHVTAAPALIDQLQRDDPKTVATIAAALGRTRERMAVDPLLALLENSVSAPVIAQALIAVRRLDEPAFDTAVTDLLRDRSRHEVMLVALTTIKHDPEGIVLPPDDVNAWITQLMRKISIADLATNAGQIAALTAVIEGRARRPQNVARMLDSADADLRVVTIRLLIAANRFRSAELARLLAYPISAREREALRPAAGRLELSARQLSDLDTGQMARAVELFALLDQSAQHAIVDALSVRGAPAIPAPEYLIQTCFERPPAVRFPVELIEQIVADRRLPYIMCNLASGLARQPLPEVKKQLSMIFATTAELNQQDLIDVLAKNVDLMPKASNPSTKISIAILTQPEITQTTKDVWVVARHGDDPYADNALRVRIESGDAVFIARLIDAGGYDRLEQNVAMPELLKDSTYPKALRRDLVSYFAAKHDLDGFDLLLDLAL